MSEEKYNFSELGDCIDAIDAIYEKYDNAHAIPAEEKQALIEAINVFLRTRTNTELLDLSNTEHNGSNIYEYEMWLTERWYNEISGRTWAYPDEIRDILVEIGLGDWKHSKENNILIRLENLELQTRGIQTKIDKLLKLLETTKISLSIPEAMKL